MQTEKMKLEKEIFTRKGKAEIIKLLGKGKSGYSYLVKIENRNYVLKIMHYEPCSYYSFGDMKKVILEVGAFYKLRKYGFALPNLNEFNVTEDYLIKEYIEGETAMELIAKGEIGDLIIEQLFEMSALAKFNSINIDYLPSNFVIRDEKLYYIDYEFNPYMQEWNLENWGIYYWANNEGEREYLSSGNILAINKDASSGIPIKNNFQTKIDRWIKKYKR